MGDISKIADTITAIINLMSAIITLITVIKSAK